MRILLLVLMLTGCATYPEKSIRLEVLVQERYDAQEICTELLGYRSLECTINTKPCTIIINPYRANDDHSALGHEFLHCLEGSWHSNGKTKAMNWKDNIIPDTR